MDLNFQQRRDSVAAYVKLKNLCYRPGMSEIELSALIKSSAKLMIDLCAMEFRACQLFTNIGEYNHGERNTK